MENHELMSRLFLAVYFNDVDTVTEIKNKFPEIYATIHRFPIDENITFDLVGITIFNQIIWFDDEWIEKIRPLVEKQRQRVEAMLNFWRSELGVEEIKRNFEYHQYSKYFFCSDIEDYDEVILDTISYFLELGFREIDLKLYNRAECFDFDEVKKLLEQGASPNIDFYKDEDDSNTFSRIVDERSFLSVEVLPEFEAFETKGYSQIFNIETMFGDILGWAAHEEMYALLKKYEEKN